MDICFILLSRIDKKSVIYRIDSFIRGVVYITISSGDNDGLYKLDYGVDTASNHLCYARHGHGSAQENGQVVKRGIQE